MTVTRTLAVETRERAEKEVVARGAVVVSVAVAKNAANDWYVAIGVEPHTLPQSPRFILQGVQIEIFGQSKPKLASHLPTTLSGTARRNEQRGP